MASLAPTRNPPAGCCRTMVPGGHTGVGLRADDRDTKALATQRIGGAFAVHANDVGHHVRCRLFTAIEQDRHLRRARCGRGILSNDDVGRIVAGSELGHGRHNHSLLLQAALCGAFVLTDEWRHDRALGSRTDPDAHGTLTPARDAGFGFLLHHLARPRSCRRDAGSPRHAVRGRGRRARPSPRLPCGRRATAPARLWPTTPPASIRRKTPGK